jgi:hypothetical protein
MYDTQVALAVLERLGEVIRDLMNQPGKGILVAGGIVLVIFWLCRK